MINKKALRIISFIIVVVIAILLLFEALKKDTIDKNDLNLLFHYSNPKPIDTTNAIKVEINQGENHQIDISKMDRCIDGNYLSICEADGKCYDLYDIQGNLVLDCDSESTIEVSNDRAIVKKNNLYGVMDLSGNWIVNPEYIRIDPFMNDRAIVSKDGRIYNVINTTGKELINDSQYKGLDALKNYIVGMNAANSRILLDFDCNTIAEIECMEIQESLSKNTIIVQKDHYSYVFKKLNGDPMLDGEEFTYIEAVQLENSQYEELYIVNTKESFQGLIDQNGNYIIPANRYRYIHYISDEFIEVVENKLSGSIDIWGNPILDLNHKQLIPLTENYVAVKDKMNLVGVVNYQGKILIDSSYLDMLGCGDGLITAVYCDEIYPNEDFMPEEENKYYYIDINGNVKIDCSQATGVDNFINGTAIIRYDGEYALIDINGNTLLGNLTN